MKSEGKLPMQVIDLSTLIRMNNMPKSPEGFVIVAGDKTLELLAETPAEKTEWMDAIKRALGVTCTADAPSGLSESPSKPYTPDPETPKDRDKDSTLRDKGHTRKTSVRTAAAFFFFSFLCCHPNLNSNSSPRISTQTLRSQERAASLRWKGSPQRF